MKYLNFIYSLEKHICVWEFSTYITFEVNKCTLDMIVKEVTRDVALFSYPTFLKILRSSSAVFV
jgi:hypothetical protein